MSRVRVPSFVLKGICGASLDERGQACLARNYSRYTSDPGFQANINFSQTLGFKEAQFAKLVVTKAQVRLHYFRTTFVAIRDFWKT